VFSGSSSFVGAWSRFLVFFLRAGLLPFEGVFFFLAGFSADVAETYLRFVPEACVV
jgi:hypothetical protein